MGWISTPKKGKDRCGGEHISLVLLTFPKPHMRIAISRATHPEETKVAALKAHVRQGESPACDPTYQEMFR
jgi:hypothetical protein